MKKIKHSKIKNTGILFELLSTQITSDMINNKKSPAIDILKEYFKKGTNLNKELSLYQTLLKEKFSNEDRANRLIDEVLKLNREINKSLLKKEKYNLIREIKAHYALEDFVKNKINNYKVYASVYKLLENKDFTFSPSEIVTSRFTLVEFITSKPSDGKTVRSHIVEEFSKHDTEVRKLAYKIIIDKFNQKYQKLGIREKTLLREYINTISDSPKMKEYINTELLNSKKAIIKLNKSVSDSAVKIKLNEVSNIIDSIVSKKKFDESTLLTVLHIYKLENELKTL
jgi:hypothetical protein